MWNLHVSKENLEWKKYSKEWAEQQSKKQKFDLPDREPGDDDITDKQFNYVVRLLKEVDHDQLRTLGKWQASELIDQIKHAQADYTEEMIEEATSSQSSSAFLKFIGIGIVVFVIIFLFY